MAAIHVWLSDTLSLGEPGSVCIKPASCHSILTSTIEKQGIVLQSGYTGRITTAMLTAWGHTGHPYPTTWPKPEGHTYSTFTCELSIFRVISLSSIPSCPFSSSFKWIKHQKLIEKCGYFNNRQKCQWQSRKQEIVLPFPMVTMHLVSEHQPNTG